ncbi:DUF6489 family protein [Sphingomonas sp. MMS24-JH45]
MKFTIEVDCSPEVSALVMGSARSSPLHDRYLSKMQDAVENGTIGPEIVGQMLKSWAPMGDVGLDFWRKLFASGTKTGTYGHASALSSGRPPAAIAVVRISGPRRSTRQER